MTDVARYVADQMQSTLRSRIFCSRGRPRSVRHRSIPSCCGITAPHR